MPVVLSQSLEAKTRTMLRKRKKFTCQQSPRVDLVPRVTWGCPGSPQDTDRQLWVRCRQGTRQGWSEQEGPEPLDPSGLSLGAGVARTKLHKQTTALVSINPLFPKGNGRFTHRILTTTAARMGI